MSRNNVGSRDEEEKKKEERGGVLVGNIIINITQDDGDNLSPQRHGRGSHSYRFNPTELVANWGHSGQN